MEDGSFLQCVLNFAAELACRKMLGIQPRKQREGGLVCSHQFAFGEDMLQHLLQAEVFREIITTPAISHFPFFYLLVEGKSQ